MNHRQALALFVVAVVVAPLACAGSQPRPSKVLKPTALGEQIFGETLPPKTVVLTFDDGPDESTLPIARYLAEEGIRVTFFVNGARFCKKLGEQGQCLEPMQTRPCEDGRQQAVPAAARYYPETLIEELLALGHRVGNHSQGHCHLTKQTDPSGLEWELRATQEILDRHICDGVYLFRAPFGNWDKATAERLLRSKVWQRMTGPIKWDVDGGDWNCWRSENAPEACADNYLRVLAERPNMNGIFIMHDRPEFNVGSDGPVLMTKILIPKLREAGYKFATLDDVLGLPPRPERGGCPDAPAGCACK